jgi:hypothetical protein
LIKNKKEEVFYLKVSYGGKIDLVSEFKGEDGVI